MWILILLLLVTPAAAHTYNDDYALLTQVNRVRILNNIKTSYITSTDLHQLAVVLAQNHAYFGCYESHVSCTGENFGRRLGRFYPENEGGAEVWALAEDPESTVNAWLGSPPHRASMLGAYFEFGGTSYPRTTPYGEFKEGIVDFGWRVLYPTNVPVISGAVWGGYAYLTYNADTPPLMAFAQIGSKEYPLSLYEGSVSRGTYRASIPEQNGCEQLSFTIVTNNHESIVFPNDDWQSFVGNLCFSTPTLLNKVRINISDRILRYTLETLPNQQYKDLSITYGDDARVDIQLTDQVHHYNRMTRIIGTYRSDTLPAPGPGRVKVYLDQQLVASTAIKHLTPTNLTVSR